jgi:hypothetical protein
MPFKAIDRVLPLSFQVPLDRLSSMYILNKSLFQNCAMTFAPPYQLSCLTHSPFSCGNIVFVMIIMATAKNKYFFIIFLHFLFKELCYLF